MTFTEVLRHRLTRVRMRGWNEWAYIEVTYGEDGKPSCPHKLWDVGCPGTRKFLTNQVDISDRWEEWIAPKNYEERKDEIYTVHLVPTGEEHATV